MLVETVFLHDLQPDCLFLVSFSLVATTSCMLVETVFLHDLQPDCLFLVSFSLVATETRNFFQIGCNYRNGCIFPVER
jgi:hypothetical protein